MYLYVDMCALLRVPVRAEAPDPLAIKSQLAVRYQTWLLGTEFELATKAMHALKDQAVSPVLRVPLYGKSIFITC